MGLIYQKNVDLSEKRRDVRQLVHKRCSVSIKIVNSPRDTETPIEGSLMDITFHGLGLCVSANIAPPKEVVVEVQGDSEVWIVQGTIVWCHPLPLSGRVIKPNAQMLWRAGIKVKSDDENCKKIMEAMVKALT
ncbi:MAG: PilZ domain-containing protein [Deltaproteobacteria bacterium]|nr:PilZ domain-containing protein [Deltaproteobacteria bacterium]